MHTWTSRCVPRLLARWSSRTPGDRPLGGGRPRQARTWKQRGCLGGNNACGARRDQVIDADHLLSSLLVKNRPDDKVKLTLIPSGKEMTVDVSLGQPPQ